MASMAAVSGVATKPLRGVRTSRVPGRQRMVVSAAARPLWLPGIEPPKYLNGSLPGDFGFDPFRLGEDPNALRWYQQAELQNGRWAMLGAAGILGEDLLGKLGIAGPAAKVPWFEAGDYQAEHRRGQDLVKPGSVNQDPIFTNNKLPDGELGYPGGIFNPLGFGKDNIAEWKLKEIKNARLAMLACAGFFAQAKTTGKTPLENLFDHLASPTAVNVLTLEPARLG